MFRAVVLSVALALQLPVPHTTSTAGVAWLRQAKSQTLGGVVDQEGNVVTPQQPTAPKALTEQQQAEAKIRLLEVRLSDLTDENTVLRAQLVLASREQKAQLRVREQAEFEKSVGCPLDWSATPVTCKAGK